MQHEFNAAEADIYRAKAMLAHAEGRYFEVCARSLEYYEYPPQMAQETQETPQGVPETPQEVQQEVPQEVPVPITTSIEISGAYCPKWTKRPHHYQLALRNNVVADKHPLHKGNAFFVLIGSNIAFLGIVGEKAIHNDLLDYTYQVSITEAVHGQVSFEEFAAHYKISPEIQKKITKARSGPKLDVDSAAVLLDIACKIVETEKLLAPL